MLRRRILASAMASVMALTSVAVVANADETSTNNVKSKSDLETLVKGFESFRSNEVYDYGTKSAERFLSALEYADNVLADSASTSKDFTVAYTMVEAVYANLAIKTSADLKGLIDDYASIWNSENLLNEEIGDLIYDEDSYTEFETAYNNATSVVGSSDSRIITDAYISLKEAKEDLVQLTQVTKSQFRTALKNYETLITNAKNYDSWRRGSFPPQNDYDWTDLNSGEWWAIRAANSNVGAVTFERLLDIVAGSGVINLGGWGEIVVDAGQTRWVDVFFGEGTSTSYEKSVFDRINEAYDELDQIKTVNKTSNETYVAAYKAAQDAITVFNAWKADDTERATKASVQKLLDNYHSQLVAKYKTSAAEELYTVINDAAPDADWQDASNAYYGAALTNTTGKTTIPTDSDKKYYVADGDNTVAVAKNVDILKYIEVTSADVAEVTTTSALYSALVIAEDYLNGTVSEPDDVYGLDEVGKVTQGTGNSVAEWTIVYRNLLYALEDEFNGDADTTYTKADVNELINKAYDLAEDTGDAAIFNVNHVALVEARQDALAWLREANKDKTYKEGDSIDGLTATEEYNLLYAKYEALEDQLADYKYSYGDVYNKIYEVAGDIDAGDLVATDELVSALNDAAYYLSIVSVCDDCDADNQAFTADREFLAYNRVHTDGDANNTSEQNLQDAYEALVAAVKAQTETTALLGDVNGDGVVNIFDARDLLVKVVAGEAVEASVGDYDASGAVDIQDAAAILKYVVANG
jgi:hypothetical protein